MTKGTQHSSRRTPDVAIVGAGVCGLGIGWRLAQAGCRVRAFDRAEAGRATSWVAAGMLAAGVEAEPGEERLLALTLESQRRWPTFVRELEDISGLDVGYRDHGTLVVALNRDEADRLRFDFEYQRSQGVELDWLSPAEARRLEPCLSRQVTAAVMSPNDHQVDNRLLMRALRQAFLEAGGELLEQTPVEAVDIEAGRVRGVLAAGQHWASDIVVLSAGPWTRELGGLSDKLRVPVRPLKGQALVLQMDMDRPLLKHVLWAPKLYLVPRRDGQLLIGATVEEKGFDNNLTAGGIYALLEGARRALPTVEELPIEEFRVGFRPSARDDAPILGPGRAHGLFVATGHHRNGILLAPITADLMAEAILGDKVPAALRNFGPDRFDVSTEAAN